MEEYNLKVLKVLLEHTLFLSFNLLRKRTLLKSLKSSTPALAIESTFLLFEIENEPANEDGVTNALHVEQTIEDPIESVIV